MSGTCKDCKHWMPYVAFEQLRGWGQCLLAQQDDDAMPECGLSAVALGGGHAYMNTRENFGCNQFDTNKRS